MKTNFMYFVGFAFLLVLMGIAGQSDYEDAVMQEKAYCEMVRIWEDDAARGVPPENRAGWPPYKGEDVPCNM